jgi:PleD family two-component response regulator
VIAFGSRDRSDSRSDLAADFLAHLGVVVAISVENAVNRARLLRSGVTDFLTGWHNRRYFHNRLREELARAERTGKALACLMIDVDHFKEINDRFGHLAGDEALKEVARRAGG